MKATGKPKATILVIDDEQIVQESVRRILEEEGYEIDGAMRVDQALDLLARRAYDIVLTDLMMPDKSGMEAVQAVATNHPETGVPSPPEPGHRQAARRKCRSQGHS